MDRVVKASRQMNRPFHSLSPTVSYQPRVEADIRKARKAVILQRSEIFCFHARATVRPGSADVAVCIDIASP